MDRSIAQASPVNAVVVLSRADEIGAARPDALDSARAIAARYAANRRSASSPRAWCPSPACSPRPGRRSARSTSTGCGRSPGSTETTGRAPRARSTGSATRTEPARRGDPRGAARPTRAVRAPARGRDSSPSGEVTDRDRAVGRPPRALGDPRAPARPRRAVRGARRRPQGPLRAGGAFESISAELDRRRVRGGRPTLVAASTGSRPRPRPCRSSGCRTSCCRPGRRCPDERRAEIDRLCGSGREGAGRPGGRRPAAGRRPRPSPASSAGASRRRQPAERPPDGRGGRDRQPRVRGDLRRGDVTPVSRPARPARGHRAGTGTAGCRVRMPPWPSFATVRSEAGSPLSSRGSSRSAAVAFEYAPQVGRPRIAVCPTRASQSIEPGWAGTPRRTTRPPSATMAVKTASVRVRAGRPGGQDQVDRLRRRS